MTVNGYVKNVLNTLNTVITVGVYDEEFDCISRTINDALKDAKYINDCSGDGVLIQSEDKTPLYIVCENGTIWSVSENGFHRKF